MANLPRDILYDIFSRLPVKVLLTCRSVNKFWCETIDHPDLATLHQAAAGKEEPWLVFLLYSFRKEEEVRSCLLEEDEEVVQSSGCSVEDYEEELLQSSGCCLVEDSGFSLRAKSKSPLSKLINEDSKISVLSSCNSLLLCADFVDNFSTPKQIFLRNPLRPDIFNLPPPSTNILPLAMANHIQIYGLGFDHDANVYKVVCVQKEALRSIVYTLGETSWRYTKNFPSYLIYGSSVFVNGSIHWASSNNRGDIFYFDVKTRGFCLAPIISFDVKTEEFYLTPVPPLGHTFNPLEIATIRLFELNGNLAIMDVNRLITVWELIETEWIRKTNFFNSAMYPEMISFGDRVIGCLNNAVYHLQDYKVNDRLLFNSSYDLQDFKMVKNLYHLNTLKTEEDEEDVPPPPRLRRMFETYTCQNRINNHILLREVFSVKGSMASLKNYATL